MVPRRAAEPRVEPLALPLSAARVPLRRSPGRERAPRQARSRVRAARHGRLRRGPLLDRRGRLREGRSARHADDRPRHERGAGGGHDPRAPDRVVPQHVGLGARRRASRSSAPAARRASSPSIRSSASSSSSPALDKASRSCSSATTRRTREQLFGIASASPTPKDGINDHVVAGADTVGAPVRDEGGVLVPGASRAGRDGRRSASGSGRPARRRSVGRLRRRLGGAPRRRRTSSTPSWRPPRRPRTRRSSCASRFAGMLWSKQLYYYEVARWLDGDPTQPTPPASRLERPQRALEDVRRVRHHVDARQVGVPVVRRVGPRLPLRLARARRPGVREVPAGAPLPRVVPAPERRARRVRVVVRRRQPAGAGVGGARGVRHRRRPRRRVPQPRLRQAARQLHVVGEPRGPRRLERLRGRLPRARQHRPDRPLAPAAGPDARAVRRHRLDGLLRAHDGGDRVDPQQPRPAGDRPGAEVPRALRADQRRARVAGPLGRDGRLLLRPAAPPRRPLDRRSRCGRSSASCRCSASRRSTRR